MLACTIGLRSLAVRKSGVSYTRQNRYPSSVFNNRFVRCYSSANEDHEAFPDGVYSKIPRHQLPQVVYQPDNVMNELDSLIKHVLADDQERLADLEELAQTEEGVKELFEQVNQVKPGLYAGLDAFRTALQDVIAQSRKEIDEVKYQVGEPTPIVEDEEDEGPVVIPDLDRTIEVYKNNPNFATSEEAREILEEAQRLLHDLEGPSNRMHQLEPYSGPDYPEYLTGPFGTRDKPVIVPSFFPTRAVACSGDYGHEHGTLWHIVNEARPTICMECGQYFKLKKLDEKLLEDSVSNKGDQTVEYLL